MSPALSDIISLNVGGTRFETTRQTLTQQCPDSMLARMFDPAMPMEPGIRTADGAYFLDRNPRYFRCLLDYLRSREVVLDGADLKGVLVEAVFFGVVPLVDRLKEMIAEEEDRKKLKDPAAAGFVRLNVSGTVYLVVPQTLGNSPVLDRMYTGARSDSSGCKTIYIDDDPVHFVPVLNAMRYKSYIIYRTKGLAINILQDIANKYDVLRTKWGFYDIVDVGGDNE